ncbi:hypothetical protein FACS189447_08550 [Spirochaetia bacterium]|nr:hypothetical protein FACS189447_08550 [Spirochaetia bacterium]
MPAGGEENFHRGQVLAFDAKDSAGAGKGRLPGDAEMFTSEAIRRPVWDFGFFI